MAQTDEQKEQASLFSELEKSDVKVSSDQVAEMKENILSDKAGGNYLGVGIHDVFIKDISLVKANSGTLGMRFSVESADGTSGVTFWLSERALPYTIQNVSRLVVHNTPEADKDKAREFMSNVVSAKELFAVAQKKLIDGVAFLSISESATRTYTNKNGEEKPSLEKNLLSYRPKQTDADKMQQALAGSQEITKENIADLPF